MTDRREMTTGEAEAWRQGWEEAKEAAGWLAAQETTASTSTPPETYARGPAADPIVAAVQADLAARSERGLAKYGTTLARTDLALSDWLRHAYEEALDLACYLKRAMGALQPPVAPPATPVAPEGQKAADDAPGASYAAVRMRVAEARQAWRCEQRKDWPMATPDAAPDGLMGRGA